MNRILTSAALALVTTFGAAGVASADTSYFAINGSQDRDYLFEIDQVTAATDGFVQIVDFASGDVIGSTSVAAGVFTDVKVQLDRLPGTGVRAQFVSDAGDVLATQRIDISRM